MTNSTTPADVTIEDRGPGCSFEVCNVDGTVITAYNMFTDGDKATVEVHPVDPETLKRYLPGIVDHSLTVCKNCGLFEVWFEFPLTRPGSVWRELADPAKLDFGVTVKDLTVHTETEDREIIRFVIQ